MNLMNRMKHFGRWIVLAALSGAAMTAHAQSSPTRDESYEWNAELVAYDEANGMITLKAMAVGDALKQAATLKPGEKISLTWSAFEKYANAVNGVLKYDPAKKPESHFVLPAEFVAFDANRSYITFKAPVPKESLTRLKSMKPGEWVTATSKKGSHVETQAIVAIRGYNDLHSASSK